MGVELLGLAVALLIVLGIIEFLVHRRNLSKIPIRIHVSGTRGKSSVTRLIAAGLRSAGIATAAKTTGTLARMILLDGREVPIFRPAGANISEQIRIVDTSKELNAQALVIECMALQPELHWLSEKKFVRATHGVITNVRADHLDVMGPTEADVARCLAGMIPVGGVLITGEKKYLEIFRTAAKDRNTRLVTVGDEDVARITDTELVRFSYVEHPENVALALKVLEEFGISREVAFKGMWEAIPDPGALTEHEIDFFGRQLIFVNAFAANDPQSTETIWYATLKRYPNVQRVIALFNLRADRPSRTIQLARSTFWRNTDRVVLMGSGAYLFARMAAKTGVNPSRLFFAEHQRIEEIFETVVGVCSVSNLIIGMANIGGQGLDLVQYFKNRERVRPAA
ncbi:MAG: poly-gamma-glutamate synthase PgsB [Pseudomonadota bacterium]